MMVKDILSGDSAKAQLRVTNQQLEETKKMVSIKDSIINKLELKNSNSEIIINSERDKFVILDEQLKKTEKELKREKTKTKIFKSLTTIGTLVIGALLITN
jgi:predicted peptidase